MGTWGEILNEINQTRTPEGAVDFDGIRRRYLGILSQYTGNNTIVYETASFAPSPDDISISRNPDMVAFMEVVHGLPKEKGLDLILNSLGGSAEAAEAIIKYLRGRFPNLRVIVPVAAMSAASMMAMAADEIIMGSHSQLGPIDPQITIYTPEGPRFAPAAAIIKQFEEARADLRENPNHSAAWLPILQSYQPALLKICMDAANLSKSIVADWLEKYMLSGSDNAKEKAERIAEFLGDYDRFKSHSRGIDRSQLRDIGLNIRDLEDDDKLQDLVLSVHHSVSHLMAKTPTTKIVENHLGKAWVHMTGTVAIQVPIFQISPN